MFPDPNSDRADLKFKMSKEQIEIIHKRNDVVADREVIFDPGSWVLTWHNVDLTFIQNMRFYALLNNFKYFPIGEEQVSFNVYLPKSNGWKVTSERGGNFTLTMILKEYRPITSSSSSSSSSST